MQSITGSKAERVQLIALLLNLPSFCCSQKSHVTFDTITSLRCNDGHVTRVGVELTHQLSCSSVSASDVYDMLPIKGLDTCYSAAYMSQTRDQQCFTISEVAADWHEPVVPQRIMWPSIAHAIGQLDPRCS